MPSARDTQDDFSLSDKAMMDLLATIDDQENLSQRNLAERIGVALGLTNALLKRCIRKGLIKVQTVPARRYVYFVTPKGFLEKSRLVSEYLTSSLDFFRRARSEYADACEDLQRREVVRVAIYGAGELAEIALLSAQEAKIPLVCVIAPGSNQQQFHHLDVHASLSEAPKLDAVIVADAQIPQQAYDRLAEVYPEPAIVTVPLLRVARRPQSGDGDE